MNVWNIEFIVLNITVVNNWVLQRPKISVFFRLNFIELFGLLLGFIKLFRVYPSFITLFDLLLGFIKLFRVYPSFITLFRVYPSFITLFDLLLGFIKLFR